MLVPRSRKIGLQERGQCHLTEDFMLENSKVLKKSLKKGGWGVKGYAARTTKKRVIIKEKMRGERGGGPKKRKGRLEEKNCKQKLLHNLK